MNSAFLLISGSGDVENGWKRSFFWSLGFLPCTSDTSLSAAAASLATERDVEKCLGTFCVRAARLELGTMPSGSCRVVEWTDLDLAGVVEAVDLARLRAAEKYRREVLDMASLTAESTGRNMAGSGAKIPTIEGWVGV